MTATDLVETCIEMGLRIEPHEDRLLVVDTRHAEPYVPSELFLMLVERRDEIRDRLRDAHFLRQVACGEFDGADGATINRVAAELQKLPPSYGRSLAFIRLVQGEEASR